MWKTNEGQRDDKVVTVDSNDFLCQTQSEVIVVA